MSIVGRLLILAAPDFSHPAHLRQTPADSMYQCEVCGHITPPRTPSEKITVVTRNAVYPFRPKVFGCWKRLPGGGSKFTRTDDKGGTGPQVVRELTACPECAPRFNGKPRPDPANHKTNGHHRKK